MALPARSIAASPRPRAPAATGVLALAALALAAPAAWAQRSSITPTFSASLELTDNRNLSATNPESDVITTLSPGVRWSSRSGRVQGSLSYSLNADFYARDSSANSLSNNLAADLSAELVEQHLFFDANASISQQSLSAFGLQGDRGTNANSTEYASLTLSPSLRGRPFGAADLEARLTSTYSGSLDGNSGDVSSQDFVMSLGESVGAIGWSVIASRSYSRFDGGRATTQDKITPRISYAFDPTFQVFITGGYERNDVLSLEPTSYKTWGGGFSWRPTPRTQFNAQTEQSYFGRSWNVSASHRMRRWLVSYSDVNDDNELTTGGGSPLSTYDLFFIQFASIEPDPVLRDVLVRNFLQSTGLDPDQQATAGFVTSAVTVTRNQNLSLAWRGRRNNVVVSAFATSSRRVDEISDAQDDFSQVARVDQQGMNFSVSHRLTQTAAIVMFGSYQRTPDQEGVQGNDLTELSLSWSDRIGPRASVSVTGRHSRATGANPYDENSLLATFNYRF
jgi:uncharacterized protein (PEP-CTERM system associated)